MKIKTKILISIIILTLIPLLLATFIVDYFYFSDNQNYADVSSFEGILFEHLEITHDFVAYIGLDQKNTYADDEIINKMQNYEEKFFSYEYGIVVFKDNDIFYLSDNFTESFPAIISLDDLIDEEEDTELQEGDVVGIALATFEFDDGSYGKVAAVVDIVTVVKNTFIYWGGYLLAYLALFIILVIVLMIWISKSIKKPLKEISTITTAMTNGDLDRTIKLKKKHDFYDLSERINELRLSLKESLEMQEKLEDEKKKIISNISHDIRTPLTAINGYAQGIKDGVAKDNTVRDEYLEIIQSKVQVVESLIDDLKVVSDLDSDNMYYDFTRVNLSRFIEDCADDLKYDIADIGGTLSTEIPKGEFFINADSEKLRRVFTNIINNSIKYRSSSPLKINMKMLVKGDHYELLIEDNGIGVAEEHIDSIFMRFFRVDESRNPNIAGTGLGLSICSDIIESHNGSIEGIYKENGFIVDISLPKENVNA